MQETFFDAFRYLASLTDKEKFFPWLCVIARRKAFRQIRYRHSDADIDELAEYLSSDGDFPAEEVIREENRERVFRAVGSLSDKRREVCELFYFRNMSVSAIAKKLSLSENTVKSRLFDTRESLRKELYDLEVQETITALEGNIRELLKRLSYYYSLNGCQLDSGFEIIVHHTANLVDRIRDEQTKQYYLSCVLILIPD